MSFTADEITNVGCNTSCTPTPIVNTVDPCLGVILTSGSYFIALYYDCGFTPTNNWATLADIQTDITAGDVVAVKYINKGRPKQTARTFALGAGLPDKEVGGNLTITGWYDKRQATGTDYDLFESLKLKAEASNLQMSTVSMNDDIRHYRTNISLIEGADTAEEDGLELFDMVHNVSWNGVGLFKPTRLAGSYNGLAAVAS